MKYIENYFGLYSVTEDGRVYSHRREKFLTSTMPKSTDTLPYSRVTLSRNGKYRKFKIHRLVAEAFIPNPENKKYVDHINRDKLDNRVSNLRWCTRIENARNKGKTHHKNRAAIFSNFKGVSWNTQYSKWAVCCVMKDGRQKNLGRFKSELEAAKKYNAYAKELYGEFAYLNDVS